MAVEAKRGCGFRKVGGLYLVSGKYGMGCCKLPFPLTICPCCGQGIKQTRGWTWVDPGKLMGGMNCTNDDQRVFCPCAAPAARMGDKAGLIWIGRGFYPTPESFMREGAELGISRRINTIPRGFELGKTWVMFAHLDAIKAPRKVIDVDGGYAVATADGKQVEGEVFQGPHYPDQKQLAQERAALLDKTEPLFTAGVFQVFLPQRIERVVKQSEYDQAIALAMTRSAADAAAPLPWKPETEELEKLLARYDMDVSRGITWFPVPDDDKDHQGSVYDEPQEDDAE